MIKKYSYFLEANKPDIDWVNGTHNNNLSIDFIGHNQRAIANLCEICKDLIRNELSQSRLFLFIKNDFIKLFGEESFDFISDRANSFLNSLDKVDLSVIDHKLVAILDDISLHKEEDYTIAKSIAYKNYTYDKFYSGSMHMESIKYASDRNNNHRYLIASLIRDYTLLLRRAYERGTSNLNLGGIVHDISSFLELYSPEIYIMFGSYNNRHISGTGFNLAILEKSIENNIDYLLKDINYLSCQWDMTKGERKYSSDIEIFNYTFRILLK